MSHAGNDSNLYPRLTVVWADPAGRDRLADVLPRDVRWITGAEIEQRAEEEADRRRVGDDEVVAELSAELATLGTKRTDAELELSELLAARSALVDDADWCAGLEPGDEPDDGDDDEAARIDELSRAVREAGRRLERVLEQRAAAERAVEEARRELSAIGATGGGEHDVRRQLEAASSELRQASAEYQSAMTELARRRARLDHLVADDDRGRPADEDRPAETGVADQLSVMRAALDAKLRGAAPSGDSRDDRGAAEADVVDAQRAADEAGRRLADARQRLTSFENELVRRSEGGTSADARVEAAAALEAQVLSVEQRLADAEADARRDVERATRELTHAEEQRDARRQASREMRRRLRDLATGVDLDLDPDHDPVSSAPDIAAALRRHAASMAPALDEARRASAELEERAAAIAGELDELRRGLERPLPVDRLGALAQLVDGPDLAVVDALDTPGAVTGEVLGGVVTTAPMVVLTADADVVGWAIELPADHGRVMQIDAVRRVLADGDLTTPAAPTAATAARPDAPGPEPVLVAHRPMERDE